MKKKQRTQIKQEIKVPQKGILISVILIIIMTSIAFYPSLKGDFTNWEASTLPKIVSQGQLAAYQHRGFWAAMDTLRDKVHLEERWQSNNAPWKIWKD